MASYHSHIIAIKNKTKCTKNEGNAMKCTFIKKYIFMYKNKAKKNCCKYFFFEISDWWLFWQARESATETAC